MTSAGALLADIPVASLTPAEFAARVLAWFDREGRHDLPWQTPDDPYRVWVSEIMLQQTQVATVLPYFSRFMTRFPNVAALAQAPLDEVLAHWSGLGYYARGRNLHRAAGVIMAQHGGRVPTRFDALVALPGIGRSTAGAIAAIAGGERRAILDGNVRRVLARYLALPHPPGEAAGERALWALAERLTPAVRAGDYAQAMMDLGATVCRRGRPQCAACPVAPGCQALAEGAAQDYPRPRRRAARPVRAAQLLLIENAPGQVLLERRPAQGIWGSLWSPPQIEAGIDALDWCQRTFGQRAQPLAGLTEIRHAFTHFELCLRPQRLRLAAPPPLAADQLWYKLGTSGPGGMPAPISRLLATLAAASQ